VSRKKYLTGELLSPIPPEKQKKSFRHTDAKVGDTQVLDNFNLGWR